MADENSRLDQQEPQIKIKNSLWVLPVKHSIFSLTFTLILIIGLVSGIKMAGESVDIRKQAKTDSDNLATNSMSSENINYVEGEFIVKYNQSAPNIEEIRSLTEVDDVSQKKLHKNIYLLKSKKLKEKIKSTQKINDIDLTDTTIPLKDRHDKGVDPITKQHIEKLSKNPKISYIEPNYITQISSYIPNDPLFSEQWSLDNTGQYNGTFDVDIDAPEAWDISQGSEDIVIAIIDTGVDYNHEDLSENMWTNPNEIPNNSVDDDLNGYIDDVYGVNVIDDSGNPYDDLGHGTHCAGIAAAVTNNYSGIAGVCPNCKIMAIKHLDSEGHGTSANSVAAIAYAINNNANILNNSWGSGSYSLALDEIVNEAINKNIVVVGSSGNHSSDYKNYPAALDGVISVSSTDNDDKKSTFSNYGSWVDVSAPGQSIYSTATKEGKLGDPSGYRRLSGTSMASPHVAGLVGLLMSENDAWNQSEIINIIKNSVDRELTSDKYIGSGRINAFNALKIDRNSPTALITSPTLSSKVSGTIDITGTIENTSNYEISVAQGLYPPEVIFRPVCSGSAPPSNGVLCSNLDTSNYIDDVYTLRIKAENDVGYTGEHRLFFEIDNYSLAIHYPLNNDIIRLGREIEIIGSIKTDQSHQFTIEFARGIDQDSFVWKSDGVKLENNGSGNFDNARLATWNTSKLKDPDFYTLRLTVFYKGTVLKTYSHRFYLDPNIREGWPQYTGPNYVTNDDIEPLVVDLENDGYKEIVLVDDFSNTPTDKADLAVYEHDGTLRFIKHVRSFNIPLIADLDNDGTKEIIFNIIEEQLVPYDYKTNEFHAVNHDGSPFIASGWPILAGLHTDTFQTFIIDLNFDGTKELIIRQSNLDLYSSGLYIISLDNEGNVIETNLTALKKCKYNNHNYHYPVAANLDDDDDLEIITTEGDRDSQQIVIINKDGSRVNSENDPKWRVDEGSKCISSAFAAGDINKDGNEEVVVVALGIYVFNKNGLLEGWPVLVNEYTPESTTQPIYTQHPALADINNDGYVEISAGKYLLDYQGRILQGWPQSTMSNFARWNSNAIADIDGDGILDIITAAGGIQPALVQIGKLSSSGGIWAWNIQGTPINLQPLYNVNYRFMNLFTSGVGNRAPVIVTDLDGNGKVDIIASSKNNRYYCPLPENDPECYGSGRHATSKNRGTIIIWEFNSSFDPELAPWPMFQHDPQRTGRLPSNYNTTGDGNNDNNIDGQDFLIWLIHYGQKVEGANSGDYDGDGQVSIADYVVWFQNFTI